MTISAKITEQEFADTRRIVWQPHYQLNRLNNYGWHRLVFFRLMGCVLVVSLAGVYLGEHFGTGGWLTAIGLGLGVVVALILHFRSPDTKLLKKLNDELPDWIDLDAAGLTWRVNDGRSATMPWSLATEWGRTETVIMIQFPKGDMYALPLTSLSEPDRMAVVDVVREKLGLPTFEE